MTPTLAARHLLSAGPGSIHVYMVKTRERAVRVWREIFVRLERHCPGQPTANATDLTITLPNGARLLLSTPDRREEAIASLRKVPEVSIWMDECAG